MKKLTAILSDLAAMLFIIPLSGILISWGVFASEFFPPQPGTHYMQYFEEDDSPLPHTIT